MSRTRANNSRPSSERQIRTAASAAPSAAGTAEAAEDYCSYGHGTTVLLVDRTTAFDQTDKTVFLQALDGVIAGLGPGDRFVLFTMTGAYTESRKLFDRCKPGCPDEGFLGGLVSSCRPVVARSEAVGFTRELAQTLAGALVGSLAPLIVFRRMRLV